MPEHLAFPPRLVNTPDGKQVYASVEQDSADHIAQRVEVTLRTRQGTRIEDPRFGVPHDVLRSPNANLPAFRQALAESEPAAATITDRITEPDDLRVDRLRTLLLEDN
jgi:phage baseplate assembly protein W